jgi:hypothetical protein
MQILGYIIIFTFGVLFGAIIEARNGKKIESEFDTVHEKLDNIAASVKKRVASAETDVNADAVKAIAAAKLIV